MNGETIEPTAHDPLVEAAHAAERGEPQRNAVDTHAEQSLPHNAVPQPAPAQPHHTAPTPAAPKPQPMNLDDVAGWICEHASRKPMQVAGAAPTGGRGHDLKVTVRQTVEGLARYATPLFAQKRIFRFSAVHASGGFLPVGDRRAAGSGNSFIFILPIDSDEKRSRIVFNFSGGGHSPVQQGEICGPVFSRFNAKIEGSVRRTSADS